MSIDSFSDILLLWLLEWVSMIYSIQSFSPFFRETYPLSVERLFCLSHANHDILLKTDNHSTQPSSPHWFVQRELCDLSRTNQSLSPGCFSVEGAGGHVPFPALTIPVDNKTVYKKLVLRGKQVYKTKTVSSGWVQFLLLVLPTIYLIFLPMLANKFPCLPMQIQVGVLSLKMKNADK